MPPSATPLTPGLLILHGNQLELLRAAVFEWLRRNPLAPLESEIFLVQSNGVAEWLKIALAEEFGVCAATRVALPARYLWESYRAMLGHDLVPSRSAFDKSPLTWRLMRLLPSLLPYAVFAPLRFFLADGAAERRLQLAERLADLFDQYQVYRADWLDDWAEGRDQLRNARGEPVPLPPEQCWQAQLWRAVMFDVAPSQRELGRVTIHQRFVRATEAGSKPAGRMPRRVVLFGISALPYQSLQALAGVARHTQVLLAVPNPCQFYWGDIIEGRELLRAAHKRQQLRKGFDLGRIALEQMHAHTHPLLASWGRQGRDFIRMLDEFDASAGSAGSVKRPEQMRIDLFSDGLGVTLLAQVQAAIRDLRPLNEHEGLAPPASDRSIEFHVAHSAQREVEVLHDQLLAMFANPALPDLRPRDIVVMVPDIDTFTAAIQAVFGQHKRSDARLIPFQIGDVNDRSVKPLLVALEWLLRLPQQRCRQSEVRDLLDVPALAARFGLEAEDLPTLYAWISGAGVRWGLDQAHRDGLALGSAGEQNAWIFGLRRMLLGYASGNGASFAGIEPYPEVGGLDAALAGSLAQLVEALLHWRAVLAADCTPAEWGVRARALLQAFFKADEDERLLLAQLDGTLQLWLDTCDNASFDEAVPLGVLREAWLGALDEPTLNHQFVSGGVTFCTLMPMRAVPFRVVCLLGMNDGDFPRRAPKADFDLLALGGMARPGDRSRRDDDRYLMLEALLAARDKLYVSWVGRNVRDNSAQPPSVLVAQLRDYLVAGWQLDLAPLSTAHALQPFSRRYFEAGGLLTYASEWRMAHQGAGAQSGPGVDSPVHSPDLTAALPPFELDPNFRLTLRDLAAFLRQPVKYFFKRRLSVSFAGTTLVGDDEEPFAFDGLERYQLEDSLLQDTGSRELASEVRATLTARAACLGREGVLPIGLAGQHAGQQLVQALTPVRSAWLRLMEQYPHAAPKLALEVRHDAVNLEDWLDSMRRSDSGDGSSAAGAVWLLQMSSKVLDKKGQPRAEKLIILWLRQLAAAAQNHAVSGYLVARDAILELHPLEAAASRACLDELLELWREGMDSPLPTACKTALALLQGFDARATYDGGFELAGEIDEPALARLWPDFFSLSQQADFSACAQRLYAPLVQWLDASITVLPIADEAPDSEPGSEPGTEPA